MEPNKRAINILNELLEKNYDAEREYRETAEEVKNERLNSFLRHNADVRQSFAIDLAEEIIDLGGKPVSIVDVLSDKDQVWMNLKTKLSEDTEEAILKECIRGEEAALKDYNKFLKSKTLDDSTIDLLEDQRSQIVLMMSELENLEKTKEVI